MVQIRERIQMSSGIKTECLMKKLLYNVLALGAVLTIAVSCEKELKEVANNEKPQTEINGIPNQIIAVIDQTKTQYAANSTFGWTNGDQVRMPVVKKSGGVITQCDKYTFTTTCTNGDTEVTFIRNGSSDDMEDYNPNPSGAEGNWTSMGYLVYPGAIFNNGYSGEYPVVELPSTRAFSSTNPLDGGVIPLIGRKDGENKYRFHTAVGVLKVAVSNLSATTTSVALSSQANYLSGQFAVSDVDATVSQIAKDGAVAGVKTITQTGAADGDYYFPVPVGEYVANDLSLKLREESGESYRVITKRIQKSINVARNEVLNLVALDMAYPNTVSVKYSCTSSPELHRNITKGVLRFYVSASADNDVAEYHEDMKYSTTGSGIWYIVNTKDKNGDVVSLTTGKYFLHYMIMKDATALSTLGLTSNDDENILEYGAIPFYYISSDVSNAIGTYYINNNSGFAITVSASDDAEKGNVMISHFKSAAYDIDMKTYGTFDAFNGKIQFKAAADTPDGYNYAFVVGGNTSSAINFNYSAAGILQVSGSFGLYQKSGDDWTNLNYGFTSPYIYKQ